MYVGQDRHRIFPISKKEVKVTDTCHLRLAHLLLVINIYAKYQVNQVKTDGEVRRKKTVTGFFQSFKILRPEVKVKVTDTLNVYPAHLLLLLNMYTKYKLTEV